MSARVGFFGCGMVVVYLVFFYPDVSQNGVKYALIRH